jgi:hypothetical protein
VFSAKNFCHLATLLMADKALIGSPISRAAAVPFEVTTERRNKMNE